jgi:tetratricopeptide (TPR) repeat protein
MRRAIEQDPRCAEAHLVLGQIARQQANAGAALKHLERAIAANPYLREAQLALAHLRMQLGRYAAAQRSFDRVLTSDPNNPDALVGRARASVELGSDEAPVYIRVLKLRGQVLEATQLRARYLAVQGRWPEARSALRRVHGRRHARREEVTLWLAAAEARLGNRDEARRLLYGLLESERYEPHARLGLSELALEDEATDTALRLALAAARAVENGIYPPALRARIGVQLARCYRATDALGAAIVELQDVLATNESHRAANLELGLIYASLNKRGRALRHLAAASSSGSKSGRVRREMQRICGELATPPNVCRSIH